MQFKHWVLTLFIIANTFSLFAGDSGFVDLLKKDENGNYTKHGWNHYGPGYFDLDNQTGVLLARKGSGLLWYAGKQFKNFILELEFKTDDERPNSGIYFRVPKVPANNDYLYQAFEIQICQTCEGIHGTGAIYDAKAPDKPLKYNRPGEWNTYRIRCVDDSIYVDFNGEQVNAWKIVAPIGKIKEWSPEGYIGIQNYYTDHPIYFRNIRIKELK